MRMNQLVWAVPLVVLSAGVRLGGDQAAPADPGAQLYRVARTADFPVDGKGGAPAWSRAGWQPLSPRAADGNAHPTRFYRLATPALH